MLHPRSILAEVDASSTFATELAWREFYADVLWHSPESAWSDLKPALKGLRYDDPEDAIEAWRTGTTGYPIVDAGMRQLLATGWMHNRVRMITASFLTKDLHSWWPLGARHFLDHLIDGERDHGEHDCGRGETERAPCPDGDGLGDDEDHVRHAERHHEDEEEEDHPWHRPPPPRIAHEAHEGLERVGEGAEARVGDGPHSRHHRRQDPLGARAEERIPGTADVAELERGQVAREEEADEREDEEA